MASGLCPSCGTPARCTRSIASSVGRRSPAFIDLTPTGPRATPSTTRPSVVASKDRRGMAPLVVLLAALAVVAGGLAVVLGGGNDATSTDIGATTTTAAAANVPTTQVQRQPGAVYLDNTAGPVFRRPAQGAIYVADGSLVKRIDLATGEITKSRPSRSSGAPGLPSHRRRRRFLRLLRKRRGHRFENDFSKAPDQLVSGGFIVNTGSGDTVWIAPILLRLLQAILVRPFSGRRRIDPLARSSFPFAASERFILATPSGSTSY